MDRATCPCCFREQAVRNSRMFRHGYRAPGRGRGYAPHIGGYCVAVGRFQPLEVSPEGTLYVIACATASEAEAKAELVRVDAGEVTELPIECKPTEAERVNLPRFKPVARMVTRAMLESGEVKPFYSGAYRWDQFLATYRLNVTHRAEAARDFITYATMQLEKHHPTAVTA